MVPPRTSSALAPTTPAPSAPAAARLSARRIGLFLAIALAVAVLASVPLATGALPAGASGVVVPLVQLAPLAAALAVRDVRRPWREALAVQVPSACRLLLAAVLAIGAFALVPALVVLLGLAAGAPLAPAVQQSPSSLLALVAAVPMVLVMQGVFAVGEELGWRGWAQSELRGLGFWRMAILIGLMWALWHLPVVLALGLQGREAVTYLVTIAAVAPLLSALREVSGTVWVAVLGHGLLNSLRVAVQQNVLGPMPEGLAWTLDAITWLLWLLAAWVVLRVMGPAPIARGALRTP